MSVAMASVMAEGEVATETSSAPSLTSPVEAVYAAIWDGFYGSGKGKLLLRASPALLPDGKPAFEIDEKTDEISLQISLAVDTSAFEVWRQDAHKRLAALGICLYYYRRCNRKMIAVL